ncbi:hypothetical protein CCP4SC76_4890003 [Gammaproteobacteria bacterium]
MSQIVKQMALKMEDNGSGTRAILDAIHARLGFAPDPRNLSKNLEGWRKAAQPGNE